jgi:hypothetical protein
VRRLALVLLVLLPLAVAAPASATQPEPSVVVVGVPGLTWDDVSAERTPTLARLAEHAALGVLSIKAAGPLTCQADGWLTLGAGNRVAAGRGAAEACPLEPERLTEVLPDARALADEALEGAVIGALGDTVEAAGECVDARGAGAALAVAEPPRQAQACAVRLVDAGAAADVSLEAVEELVAREQAGRPPGSTLLVVGVSEARGAADPRLHVALAEGPGFAPGALVSPSTRRPPYVQLIDVAPTVLDVLGLPVPAQMTGQPWQSVGEAPELAQLRDLSLRAVVAKDVTVPFFVVLAGAQLALLVGAAWRRRPRTAELVALGATAALAASYLANLVPWWRADLPLLALLAVVVAISAVAVAPALHVPGRLGPAGAVCGFGAAVLCLDLVTGARLQIDAVAGYSPLVAGRFAGIGNVAFGVLAASALLAAAALTERRPTGTAAGLVAALGAVVVVVDGAPVWGSDVGGVLALVPAFALLAMLRAGLHVSVVRLLAAGLAGVAVVSVFALADYARAPDRRTHLGRFVADLADGTAGTVLRRKADAVLGLLFSSPVTALLPLVVAAAVYLVLRPPAPLARAFAAAPAWRHGLLAVGLASAIGFAVNDSGAAVPALALLVAVPGTAAVVARVSRRAAAAER